MTQLNLNPNRKTVFNPTMLELSWRWDGMYYFIAPNGTLAGPLPVMEHLLKHLRAKGLKECTLEDSNQAKYKEFYEDQKDGIRNLEEHEPVSEFIQKPVAKKAAAMKVERAKVAAKEAPVSVPKVEETSGDEAAKEAYVHCELPYCVMTQDEAERENYIHCNGTDNKTGEPCPYVNTEAGTLMHQRTKHRIVTHNK